MKMIKGILNKRQNKYLEAGISWLFIGLSLAVFCLCISLGLGEDIWFDEVFSVNFIRHSYGEIAALTAKDVHPPLYYWYLKLFHDIGKIIIPSASSIVLCKMASMLPFIGIFGYAFTLIRKRFGMKVTGFFLFLIAAMPQISNYTVEIRMYSLALFFITAIFLHSYELVLLSSKQEVADESTVGYRHTLTGKNKSGFIRKNVHWIAFWFYGILTAYTQYYACIAVVAVYIALFVFFALQKQKKMMIKVLICAGLSVAAYLPWIPTFVWQLNTVSNSYWIQPLTFRSIFGCIKYIFLPMSYATTKNYILAVVMIVIFGLAFLCSFIKKKDMTLRFFMLGGVFIPIFTAFMGFVCSLLNRPIFVYRYLIPCLGAMWLVAAYVIIDSFSKNWGILILVPFLIAGHSNMEGFYAEEHKKITEMETTQEFLNEFPKSAVVLCNFNHVQALTACYLDESNVLYLYGGEPESLIQKMLPNCKEFEDVSKLKELVASNDVYFWGSFNTREELLAEWAEDGITYTEEGTYLLERYWFNVYHLSVKE